MPDTVLRFINPTSAPTPPKQEESPVLRMHLLPQEESVDPDSENSLSKSTLADKHIAALNEIDRSSEAYGEAVTLEKRARQRAQFFCFQMTF